MMGYACVFASITTAAVYNRRGDRGGWISSVEGRGARHSSFVGGEGGAGWKFGTDMVKQIAG